MYMSTLHFDKRSMYAHVSTSIKSLRCRFTHNRMVSVFVWYLSLAFGLMSRRVYQGSRAIRYMVGHYMTSALFYNRVPGFAGCFAILDIHSFFALTSLRSVPAIMIAGNRTKHNNPHPDGKELQMKNILLVVMIFTLMLFADAISNGICSLIFG